MGKQKNSPIGKRLKAGKKSPSTNGNPEWEDLEERFHSLNVDFNKLAAMIDHE